MINRWLFTHLPSVRQVLTRITYEYISLFDKDKEVLFMNYGFADLDSTAKPLELSTEDEKHRCAIRLYHHLASHIDWQGMDALEVSSGRGGGAYYIYRCFQPGSLTGVDFSRAAVDFCQKHYSADRLTFVHGDAEALQFPDNSFDVIINVEASLYYPRIERFFQNVVRMLKPNGYFIYADMRYAEELQTWENQLRNTGLELLKEENISPNVIKALDLEKERKLEIIQRYTPRFLHGAMTHLGGIDGADLVEGHPQAGERTYKSYIFRKKENAQNKMLL